MLILATEREGAPFNTVHARDARGEEGSSLQRGLEQVGQLLNRR